MTRDDMTIIAKLEAATDGSRELDAAIAESIGWTRDQRDINGNWRWLAPKGPYTQLLPKWTTSIDAALTLVPEDWAGQGSIHWPGYDAGRLINRAFVRLHHYLSSGGGPRVDGYGATPALALCITALKARA